jgi:drug/metabolite transporter (DMT)-like permease
VRKLGAGHAGLLGTAGALSIAFSGIFVRLSGASPSTVAVYRCLYALPVLGALALLERRRFGPRPWRQRALALVAGTLLAADLLSWHHSIAAVGAGLATVLANTQVVFVGLLAWVLLRERPQRGSLVAVPIVLAGIIGISGLLDGEAYGANPGAGVAFGVLTALMYSGFLLVLRAGNKDLRRPAGPLFDATAAAAVTATLLGAVAGDLDTRLTWPAHGWLLALALSAQVLGWLLISTSLPRLPALVTSLLLTIQPVASVLLGILLLGESPSPLQLAGVATIVGGVTVATLGLRRSGPDRALESHSARLQPERDSYLASPRPLRPVYSRPPWGKRRDKRHASPAGKRSR